MLFYTGLKFNFYDVLVMAMDERVMKEQVEEARKRIAMDSSLPIQRRLNFEMSVRNLFTSLRDRERVQKIQGLLNEAPPELCTLCRISKAYARCYGPSPDSKKPAKHLDHSSRVNGVIRPWWARVQYRCGSKSYPEILPTDVVDLVMLREKRRFKNKPPIGGGAGLQCSRYWSSQPRDRVI